MVVHKNVGPAEEAQDGLANGHHQDGANGHEEDDASGPSEPPQEAPQTSSDEDSEDDHDQQDQSGYEMLPQDEEEGHGPIHDPVVIALVQGAQRQQAVLEAEERVAIYSATPSRPFHISPDDLEAIRRTMSAFSLPDSSIPAWAVDMSDDQWRQMIRDRIHPDGTLARD